MIFQNRRLILARKIVIEWRFHVLSFYIFRLNFNQIRRLFLISAAQILRRWFSALTQTGTRSGKRRKINFAACRRISRRRLRFSVHFIAMKPLIICAASFHARRDGAFSSQLA